MALKTKGHDPEEALRLQREAERKAQEEIKRAAEATRIAQEQAQEATEEAERASKESEQKAAGAVKAAVEASAQGDVAVDGVGAPESPGIDLEALKGYAPPEEWTDQKKAEFDADAQFTMNVNKAVKDTKVKYREFHIGELPEQLESLRSEIEKSNRTGELRKRGAVGKKDWIQNEFDIEWGSIKNNDQAMYFATTLTTDKDKTRFFKEYAQRTGQNYYTLLNDAESKLGSKLFSTPQTNLAKTKVYGQGMLSQGPLLDVDGNEINIATASQPQIEQALRLMPDNKKALDYYEAFAEARGWKIDKSSLGFMESADLTEKDYNDAVDDYNKLFTIGHSDANYEAYEKELGYIHNQKWPLRVKKQMEAALKRSYEERTGIVAPTYDEIQAALKQAGKDKPSAGADGQSFSYAGLAKKIGEEFVSDWNSLLDLFRGKGKAEKEEEIPLPAPGKPKETAQAGSGGSVIASGGKTTVNGQEVSFSQPIASAGSMPPKDELYPEIDAISSSTMHVAFEDAQNAHDAQAKTYANNVAYDPNMSDEQALAYWRKGGELDPRNKEQISWFTDDPAISGTIHGLNPNDVDWDIGEHSNVKYDTTQFWQYGPTIGKAIGAMNSGVLTDDMENTAALTIGSALKTLRADLADPLKGISVPSDQHAFEYMLSLPEYSGVANSLKSVTDAQKDVLRINQENQIDAAVARKEMIDGYKAGILAGNGTPEILAIVANEYPMADHAVISRDKRNIELKRELSSNYYQNENEGFWAGDSAAAIEFKNMRTLGGDADTFKLFHELEMENVIDDYTSAAYNMGMGLDEYLASAGINDFDSIAEIAYNGMQAMGKAYGDDVAAQEAIETIAKNPIGGLKAFGAGIETAIVGTNANLMQTAYMVVEPAMYERNVQKLRNKYVPEYGPDAPYMYWQDLMRASETMSEEQRAELMRNIGEVNDIFEVGYVIDEGILEKVARNPADRLQKTFEALVEEAQTLPDSERTLFDLAQMGTNTLYGMALATSVGAVTGSALTGAAIAYGAPTYADSYFSVREKGAYKNTSRWFAFAHAAATTALNTGTTGQQMDIWGDMSMMTLYEKLYGKSGLELYKQIGAIIAKQATSEGGEELAEYGVDLAFDYAGNAVAAHDKGMAPKLSDKFKIFVDSIYETDWIDVFKEGAKNYGAGFLMGGVFTLAGVAKALPSIFKGAKMERHFASLETSRKMMDGAIPFTEENIGKVYTQVMEDLQDPEFVEWIDSADAMAINQNNMVMSAMSGVGEESREAAVTEADRAKGYREKETAAKNAFNAAESRWIELRQQVMDGDLDAVPSMTTAQQQMGKAKTALIEYRTAAEKSEKKSAESLRKWMQECGAANSHVMAYRAMRWKAQQLLLARELQAKYEAEEAAAVKAEEERLAAERSEAAATQEVAYAENAVFGEAPEMDEQIIAEEDGITAMTDEELDSEISSLNAQIADAETRIAEVTAQREELGLTDENVQELVEQEITPLAKRKEGFIAREKSRFNDLYGRMQHALEMDSDDAAMELHKEYEGVYTRLKTLGVDADQMMLEQYGITNEDIEADQEQTKKAEEEEKQNKLTDSLNRRMQATNDSIEALKPVRQYFAKTKLFVNKPQAADILAAEGLKSIPQFNFRYHTQLTTNEKEGALPLDGHPFTEINDEAPGVIDVNAEPVGEMLRILHAGKDLAAKHVAEKEEARNLREKKKASKQKRVEAADALVKPIQTQEAADAENDSASSAIKVTPQHTTKQQKDIIAYHSAVNSEVYNAAQAFKENPGGTNKRVPISEVDSREANDILNLTGVDVAGYVHTADRNFFTHVERRHGENGEADNSMSDLKDVARVGWIIENYDSVELLKNPDGSARRSDAYLDKNQEHMPLIRYVKRLDGSVYVVEAIGESKWKKLWLVSAYIQKNGPVTQSQNQAVTQTPHTGNQPLGNVRNANASPATSSVAQGSGAVNTNSGIDAMASSGSAAPMTPATQQKVRSKKAEASALKSIQNLAKEMKVGLRIKSGQRFQSADARMGKGVLGYYKNGQRNAILRSLDAGRLDVAGHEIGHAVQEQIGLKSNQQMINSWQTKFGNTAAYTPDQYDHEAFAEFFWRYLGNRDDAVAFAGDAYVDAFEQALRQKKLYKAVNKAQMQVIAFMQSEADTKIKAKMVDAYAAKAKEDAWFNKRIIELVDDTAAAEAFQDMIRAKTSQKHLSLEDNLRDTVRFNRRAGARAAEIMTTRLVDQNGDEVGESMKDALSDVDGKNFDMFWEWMLAKHSLARDTAKGAQNQVFDEQSISTAEREAFIKQVEREHPEFVKANDRFQKWRRLFMDTYLVRNGFLGENGDQLMDMLDAMYPNYVPTYRVNGKRDRAATVGGKIYQMYTATGSTEDIINPFDSYVNMVNSIVQMVADNDSRLKFADLYDRFKSSVPGETGAGVGWFANELTQDMQRVSVSTESMRKKVEKLLDDIGTDPDVIVQVGDIIGDEKVEYRGTGRVNMKNVITIRNPDGSKRYFEMYDPELYTLLANSNTMNDKGLLDGLASVTRMMSMLTTGSNPIFGLTNAMRDFQTSVNYGSWAASYTDGAVKWLGALWDVMRNGKASQEYDALGGGGWTAYDTATKKGSEQIRGEVFKGYNTSNVGRFGKMVGRTVWKIASFERVNEAIEKASRLAEYKYGKHDLSTTEGRIEAFLAAQDVTTDFARRGNGQVARDLKNLIPFFNASMQGVYRTGRQFTAQESDRAKTRFTKNVINSALASALANAVLLKYLDDDEKEEYAWLSDDLKAKHMFIPNFAPDIFGNAALIRIPIEQNPVSYAINAAVSNFIWKGETDNEFIVEIGAVADAILDNLNPVGSTILDPLIATKSNKNWYGSNIVPSYLESYDETNQYTEETPTAFVNISKGLAEVGVKVSPMMLQYMAEQWTGYIGQTLIPALPSEKNDAPVLRGWLDSLVATARKRVTTDPLASNDVVGGVYDSFNELQAVYKAGNSKRDFDIDYLNPNLSSAERRHAISEADDLIHSGGDIYEAKKDISALYDKIDEINDRDDLADDEKYVLVQKVRRDMVEIALDAQEIVNDYDARYKDNSIIKKFMNNIFLN